MTYQFSVEWRGVHASVTVKAGADRDHLMDSGTFTLSEPEWTQLKRTLEIGAKKSQAVMIFDLKE